MAGPRYVPDGDPVQYVLTVSVGDDAVPLTPIGILLTDLEIQVRDDEVSFGPYGSQARTVAPGAIGYGDVPKDPSKLYVAPGPAQAADATVVVTGFPVREVR